LEQSTAEAKALKEGEERRKRSEDGGIDIARYYRGISVSKVQERKLTVTVIDAGNNTEIIIKHGVQCVKGGGRGKEGREYIGDGSIDIAWYYKSISASKMQKTGELTVTIIDRCRGEWRYESDTGRGVEIWIKQGTRYAIAGRRRKEGWARNDNGGINNGRYYKSTAEAKALKEGEEERRDGNIAKMAVSISHDTTKVLVGQKCGRRENSPLPSSTWGAMSRSSTESNASKEGEEERRDGNASAMAVSISHDTTKVLAHQKCKRWENLPSPSSTDATVYEDADWTTQGGVSRLESSKEPDML
jgi:hypothetical protein